MLDDFRNVSEGLMFYRCTFYASAVLESSAEALWFSVVCLTVRYHLQWRMQYLFFNDLFNRSNFDHWKKQQWTAWNLMIIDVWLSVMLYVTFQFQLHFIVTVSLSYFAIAVKFYTKW